MMVVANVDFHILIPQRWPKFHSFLMSMTHYLLHHKIIFDTGNQRVQVIDF